ncbi:MAG: hypothetical protein C9356_02995 [Oleiphilus sp.]|jgi:hypothetical protein|nr:MAG: hypothetical protein C9356_02995 [Oleiphilus sp.]
MEKRARTGSARLLVYGLLMQQIGHSKRPQVAAGKDGVLRVIGTHWRAVIEDERPSMEEKEVFTL